MIPAVVAVATALAALQAGIDVDRKETLKECLRHFNLSGSRYFHRREMLDIPPNTDWDFYTDNSIKNSDLLDKLGFELAYSAEHGNYEGDDWLSAIYKHHDYNIEVLLRTKVNEYSAILESIDWEFYKNYLWKSGPNRPDRDQIQSIFNQMFKIYELV